MKTLVHQAGHNWPGIKEQMDNINFTVCGASVNFYLIFQQFAVVGKQKLSYGDVDLSVHAFHVVFIRVSS